jgi:uncharacterized protein YjbI with pentapeptide repeats
MTAPESEKVHGKCRVMMSHGNHCGRESYDSNGLCICHSKDPNKDRSAFKREIEAMLARKDYDFSVFFFPDGWRFLKVEFNGGAPSVEETVFQGDANFVRATFGGDAIFVKAEFLGEASFSEAVFQSKALFPGVKFGRKAEFASAKFQSDAMFNSAEFTGEASFWQATFGGGTDFGAATFHSEAHFNHAVFADEVVFVGEDNLKVFSDTADTDFRWVRFHGAKKVLFQHVFLGRARFLNADVRRVDFTDVEWPKRPGGRFAVWDEFRPEGEGEEKDYALIGKLYRQLKHNYEEQRDPITAGDFHFGEMHMRRLSNPPKNRFARFLKRNLSFLAFYRWISGYGEDYILPLVWIAGVILVFAAAFVYIPAFSLQASTSSGAPQPAAGFFPRLLYSVMCFLLRGDKPLHPEHLAGHYLSVAEGIIGPPLIAMFVLALNRRFKR